MKVLVVGGGGREHIIIKKLKENASITKLYCAPGNGGIAADAECVAISSTDIDGLVYFAMTNDVDFVVVAPDDPLYFGAVDRLHAVDIPCFGPVKAAAEIEGSKVFSKNLMKRYGIPTASYEVFDDATAALSYVKRGKFPVVIKADGLALGKGVIIAQTLAEAEDGIKQIMCDKVFGVSGNRVVIEEFLTGPEVSVLAFTDGETMVPMVSSMDHKRALDGDEGLNTGGMGTIAPNPFYTEEIAAECLQKIFLPTMYAMNKEGRTFRGCLYFGLMLTADGPKVIEYNCRFGDPEAQVVLPLLKTDLFDIFKAVEEGRLKDVKVEFSEGAACCVIMASGGYPKAYEKNKEITIGDVGDSVVCHAGTKLSNGKLLTSGGRVLGVVALADTLQTALDKAYTAVDNIQFEGAHVRRDIGARALKATR